MKSILLFAALFYAQATFAFPTLKSTDLRLIELPAHFTASYDFEGIVALSNCSGSLIQLENSKPTDKAWILTNGHCLETGFPKPGTIVLNKPSTRKFTLLTSNAQKAGTVNATKILYGTMTKTDMAIYELKETFADIKTKFNINPMTLSYDPPQISNNIDIISGYWKRGYGCAVDAIVHQLKEGNWICEDSIRYTNPGCEVIGGTSGSPVTLANTKTVVGVNNTGNEDGKKCTESNPCEIDEHGNITFQKGYSYAQQTYWVYSCLDNNNQFDLNRAGCLLFK